MSKKQAGLLCIGVAVAVYALAVYVYPKVAYDVRCWAAIKRTYVDVSEWQSPKTIMHIGDRTTIVGFVKSEGKQFEYSCTVERFQVEELKVADNAILRAWAKGEE